MTVTKMTIPGTGSTFAVFGIAEPQRLLTLDDIGTPLSLYTADVGVTETSGDVSAWADQGTGNYDVTASTSALQPTYSATGWDGTLPSLSFDGVVSGNLMTNTDGPFAQIQTIFAVVKRGTQSTDTSTGFRPIYTSARAENLGALSLHVANIATDASQTKVYLNTTVSSGSSTIEVSGLADGDYGVVIARMNFTTGAATLRVNGGTDSTVTFAPSDSPANNVAGIGGHPNAARRFAGHIAAIGVFNSWLSDTELQKLEGVMAWDWDIASSLATGHPYKTVAPST